MDLASTIKIIHILSLKHTYREKKMSYNLGGFVEYFLKN